jgi:hypothetical protein
VRINYSDANMPLATWDAHLAFVHLPEGMQDDILKDARRETHEEIEEFEPEHFERLVDADESFQSDFSFDGIEIVEIRRPGIDEEEFTPSDGLLETTIDNRDSLDEYIAHLAEDWAEEFLKNIEGEVNKLQKQTSLSNREFVAFVLAESPRVTWARAAELMGITEGTFSGKIGDKVRPKIEEAEATAEIAKRVRRDE